jgi:hypothetical protein
VRAFLFLPRVDDFFLELTTTHQATGGVDLVPRNFRSAT